MSFDWSATPYLDFIGKNRLNLRLCLLFAKWLGQMQLLCIPIYWISRQLAPFLLDSTP